MFKQIIGKMVERMPSFEDIINHCDAVLWGLFENSELEVQNVEFAGAKANIISETLRSRRPCIESHELTCDEGLGLYLYKIFCMLVLAWVVL